jgi:hypothetical protein
MCRIMCVRVCVEHTHTWPPLSEWRGHREVRDEPSGSGTTRNPQASKPSGRLFAAGFSGDNRVVAPPRPLGAHARSRRGACTGTRPRRRPGSYWHAARFVPVRRRMRCARAMLADHRPPSPLTTRPPRRTHPHTISHCKLRVCRSAGTAPRPAARARPGLRVTPVTRRAGGHSKALNPKRRCFKHASKVQCPLLSTCKKRSTTTPARHGVTP